MSNWTQGRRRVTPELRVGDYVRYSGVHEPDIVYGRACGIVIDGVPYRQGMVRVCWIGFESYQHVYVSNLERISEREWAVYAASKALGVEP